jgi:DegV family protein with EDD domain
VNLSTNDFWAKMKAPDSPFPTTAACSPGDFQIAYQKAFDAGADGIVSIHVAGTLSGTIKAAEIGRAMFKDRDIHVVDSMSASMGEGMLAEMGVEMSNAGASAAEIAETVTRRRDDLQVYLALETLEYLKRGGRISGAQAAIGSLLSVKPIIEIKDGKVETAERVRTRGKAREKLVELLTRRPMDRLSILHTTDADVEEFAEQLIPRVPGGIDRSKVSINLVGPSVGPHLGPGCVGAVALYTEASRPA